MANFNLPDISGEFTPQQPKPKTIEDVMHDAEVVRALSDPQGYIQDKQLGQISKGIANLKTDKIIEPLQMMANDRINQHIGDVQKLYSGNTGFNKYRLDSKQNIQKQAYERKLFGDMGTLNEFTKDYNDLQNYGIRESAGGKIDQKELDNFWNVVDMQMKKASTTGNMDDLPHMKIMFAQMVHPKQSTTDYIKQQNEFTTFRDHTYDDILVGQTDTPGELSQSDKEKIARKVDALPPQTLSYLGGNGTIEQQKQAVLQGAFDRRKKHTESALGWANFNFREDQANKKEAAKTNNQYVIPDNQDNRGQYWDLSAMPKKFVVSPVVRLEKTDANGKGTGEYSLVKLNNATVTKVRRENGQLKAEIAGTAGTGANAVPVIQEIPFTRAMYEEFRKIPGHPDLDNYMKSYGGNADPVTPTTEGRAKINGF